MPILVVATHSAFRLAQKEKLTRQRRGLGRSHDAQLEDHLTIAEAEHDLIRQLQLQSCSRRRRHRQMGHLEMLDAHAEVVVAVYRQRGCLADVTW
jgi:hypothetical protein